MHFQLNCNSKHMKVLTVILHRQSCKYICRSIIASTHGLQISHIYYWLVIAMLSFPLIVWADENDQSTGTSIVFTSQEAQWLETHREVSFTGDPNWLPYEAFTPSGEYIGIVASHLELITKATGIKFKLSPSETWTESTHKAKNGLVDVLSETDDSDLKSYLNFTQPYLSNPIVIAMSIKENYVENISSIADKRIALIKDYGYASKIRRSYPDIDFVTVDNIQDGLISVSTGKVDALFCTLALCSYTIHDLGLSDVKITGKTEFETKLAFGVQKNQAELLSIMNKAIKNISHGEQQLILNKWLKHNYVEKTDYTLVIIITVIALLLIFIFYYWNRRLTKEISLRNDIEKKLQASIDTNERYRILFYESPVGHAVNKLSNGSFLSVNNSFAEITGYKLEELNTLSYWDLTPKSYAEEEAAQLKSLNENGKYGPYEKHYIHKNGSLIAVRLNGTLIDDQDEGRQILSVVENISEYEEARNKLRLSALIMENTSEGMLITDENNNIITANQAFTDITGYSLEEAKGMNPHIFKSDRHDNAFYQDMWNELNETGHWQGEIWDKRKDGEVYVKWLIINSVKDKTGSVNRYVALFSDITDRKLSEETIWKQANFDTLTELPNRNMFQERLKQEILKSSKDNLSFAVLLIDLDRFKEVNDTLGHDKGDLLLKVAGRRISDCIRTTDTLARLGGDEFIIILSDFKEHNMVNKISQSLIASLVEPYELNDDIAHISASIGITIYPDDATEMDALMKNADQAMYEAKNKGRNRYSYFTQSLQDAAQKRLRLSTDLRTALSLNQFKIYFQPIIDLSSNKICKAEALLRWFHPQKGMISPLDFIPVAEDIGAIIDIGSWVCVESKKWKAHWRKKYIKDFQISVNMSPIQFKVDSEDFCYEWITPEIDDDNNNQNIIIEITEGLLLDAEPDILEKFYRLRDAGVEVAIDDFGTGYSSLSYLKKFDIDYLKIDQSFTKNLENDPNDLALSEAIIVMAHKLGLKVIAEGVENLEQHKILVDAGCDFSQGYLYSRPVPPEEFELLFDNFEIK